MLITVDKLSIDFNEDEQEMEHQLAELKKLEKAIEDSTHFKLLAGKTQMIARGKGKVQKERSRLQHTRAIANLVVKPQIEQIYDRILQENPIYQTSEKHKRIFELNKQIAITRGMCMAKAHDIGHVPFGHEGERAINDFFSSITKQDDVSSVLAEHLKYFGRRYEQKQGHIDEELVDEIFPSSVDVQLSFEHNELSGILLNQIMQKNGIDLSDEEKLALTLGVLGHSTSRTPFELLQNDLVAQIVRVADKVEYINFDYDEIAGLIAMDISKLSKEQIDYLRKSSPERIKETNRALVEEAFSTGRIYEKNPAMKSLTGIRKAYDDLIYLYDGMYADGLLRDLLSIADDPEKLQMYYDKHPGVEAMYSKETLNMFKRCRQMALEARQPGTSITAMDLENAYNKMTTEQLHFKGILQGENSDRISLIYDRILKYYYEHQEEIPEQVSREMTPIDLVKSDKINYSLTPDYTALQRTLEYISLMDDQEMMDQYHILAEKRIKEGEGHGIKPISMNEVKQFLREFYDQEVEKYRRTRQGEDEGVYNFSEARKKYTVKSREFFDTKLTKRGKEALAQSYQERFLEYAEDHALFRRMKKMDKARIEEKERKKLLIRGPGVSQVLLETPNVYKGVRNSKPVRKCKYVRKPTTPLQVVKNLLGMDTDDKDSTIRDRRTTKKDERKKKPINPNNPGGSPGESREHERDE